MSANELSEEFLLPPRSTDKLLPLLLERIIWGKASLERERPLSGTLGEVNMSLRTFLCFLSSTSLSRRCLSWM